MAIQEVLETRIIQLTHRVRTQITIQAIQAPIHQVRRIVHLRTAPFSEFNQILQVAMLVTVAVKKLLEHMVALLRITNHTTKIKPMQVRIPVAQGPQIQQVRTIIQITVAVAILIMRRIRLQILLQEEIR